MAIAYDTSVTQQTSDGSGSTLTFSFTTTGTNRYLLVGCLNTGYPTVTMTSVTYGGVAMTQIGLVDVGNVSGTQVEYLYGLANPASGANNIVLTASGTCTIAAVAASYTGAQQTTALEASGTATGASGTGTKSITTITNNAWLVGHARGQSNASASTSTTFRPADNAGLAMMDSNADKTPAGSYSLNFTTSGNNNWGILVASIAPYVAPSGPVGIKSWNGLTVRAG